MAGKKDYFINVVCYSQKRYQIKAKSLEAAQERYNNGDYDLCHEGGALDGEIVNEEWEEEAV